MKMEVQSTSKSAVGPNKIDALTSLRFFAALYVVCLHTFRMPETYVPWFFQLISMGYISVSFFFFLSGYILAIVYLAKGKAMQAKRFFYSRFARIYPLFALTLLADMPRFIRHETALHGSPPTLAQSLAVLGGSLLMLQAWTTKLLLVLNFPAWSLSVETFFYLCFPLLGVALWKLRGKRLLIATAGIYLGGQILVRIAMKLFTYPTIRFNPVLHLSTFALGICLARWQGERDSDKNFPAPPSALLSSVFVCSLGALLIVIFKGKRIPFPNLHDGVLAPVFAGLIWSVSYSSSTIGRWLSVRWLVLLGESSFALYLIHVVVFFWYQPSEKPLPLWNAIGYVVACILLSILSFLFLESPVRVALLKLFKVRSQESMQAASDA